MNTTGWKPIEQAAEQAAMRIANVQIQTLGGQLAYARSICRILAGICTVQAFVIVALGALLAWRW